MKISRIGEVKCRLGEGPVWDVQEQALYFVDVRGKTLWRHDPSSGAFRRWELPLQVGSFALRQGGGALLALEDGFYSFDFDTGATELVALAPGEGEKTILNDGKADPRGRFLAGGCVRSLADPDPCAALHSLAPDGTVTRLDQHISVANGPCWSPDGKTFYFTDSMPRAIYAYDYDLDTGAVANRRVFADTTGATGVPDGATVDADGNYWVAMCMGGRIVCYSPAGVILRSIDVPAAWVSSVMFGGPGLDQLYFTSIDPAVLDRPSTDSDGGLYVIEDLGAVGLPEHRFAG